MATRKKWMAGAFKNAHGQLHRTLGVPQGETIPAGKLERAEHSSNTTTRRRAVLAATARRVNRG